MTPGQKVQKAGARYRRALAERDTAIREAAAAGTSLRDIGYAAGLSHTAIAKILKRR